MTTTMKRNTNSGGYNGEFKQYLGFEKKFGYLHEFHKIPGSQPKSYTVRISVPCGQGERVRYEDFELYVKSAEALSLFFENQENIKDEKLKKSIRFSCSNMRSRGYIVRSGERTGEVNTYMLGNLNYIFSMKVDGDYVYGSLGDNSEKASDTENSTVKNQSQSSKKHVASAKNRTSSKAA